MHIALSWVTWKQMLVTEWVVWDDEEKILVPGTYSEETENEDAGWPIFTRFCWFCTDTLATVQNPHMY